MSKGEHDPGRPEQQVEADVAAAPTETVGVTGHGDGGDRGAGDDARHDESDFEAREVPISEHDAEQHRREPVTERTKRLRGEHESRVA